MKTAKINLNYDFTEVEKVEIENNMAPLSIGVSESGKLEIEAELDIHSFIPGKDMSEHFIVDAEGHQVTIELEEIPGLYDSLWRSGKSQVWIRVPKGAAVIATAEVMPLRAEGLEGALVIHNENGPVSLEKCSGHTHIEAENGPISLRECSGEFEIDLENGPLVAEKVSGSKLEVEAENSPLKISQAAFPLVNISTENGLIYYETLPVENGEFSFSSENGRIHLSVPEDFAFELQAETENGSVTANLDAEVSTEGGRKVIRRGEGGARISVHTENGAVKVSSGGKAEFGFISLKLAELKELIGKSVSEEDKEKALRALEKVTAAIERAINSVAETNIQEKLAASLAKLKSAVEEFEVQETKDKVIKAVEQAGDELADGLKIIYRKVKGPFREGESRFREHREHFRGPFVGKGFEFRHEFFDPESIKDYVHKAMESALSKAGKGLSGREKSEVDERSRIKILEMLEAGKITAEEAERLLKAIGKE